MTSIAPCGWAAHKKAERMFAHVEGSEGTKEAPLLHSDAGVGEERSLHTF